MTTIRDRCVRCWLPLLLAALLAVPVAEASHINSTKVTQTLESLIDTSGNCCNIAYPTSTTVLTNLTTTSGGVSTLKMNQVAPGAPTVALAGAGAGNVDNGAHLYKVTLVTAAGETEAGTASGTVTVVDKTVNGQVAVSAIPTGSLLVTSRKIYRTAAGGSTYKLLTTIADNTTTIYTDNTADSGLGATAPTTNSALDTRVTIDQNGKMTSTGGFTFTGGQLLLPDGTAAAPSVAATNYPSTGVSWGAGPKLFLGTNGAAIPEVTLTGGNVGIGTTSPSSLLQLNNTLSHTSGSGAQLYQAGLFTPASGTGAWALAHLNPTINGTSSGTAYGLVVASKTNVLTGGTIRLLSLGTTTTDAFTGYTSVFDVSTNGGVTASGPLVLSSVGPHAIGGATDGAHQLKLTGTFSGAGDVDALYIGSTVNVVAGQRAFGLRINGTVVEAGSGNHSLLANLYLDALNVTAGAATVTDAATLVIGGAPSATVSGTNYAAWIQGGNVRFGDGSQAVNVTIGRSAAVDATIITKIGADSTSVYDVTSSATASMIGLASLPSIRMTGNHTSHFAFFARASSLADGVARTVSNQYGGYLAAGAKDVNTTVTNAYGLYIEAPTIGGTLNVGLYNAGTSTLVGAVTASNGITVSAGNVQIPNGSQFRTAGMGALESISDGVFRFANSAGTDYSRLIFGTNNTSGVALVKDGAYLQLRLGDGSAVTGAATASLPVAAAARDGIIGFDTTVNALVYYVGGARYKLVGTAF